MAWPEMSEPREAEAAFTQGGTGVVYQCRREVTGASTEDDHIRVLRRVGARSSHCRREGVTDIEREQTRMSPVMLDWNQKIGVSSWTLISIDKYRNDTDAKFMHVCVCLYTHVHTCISQLCP